MKRRLSAYSLILLALLSAAGVMRYAGTELSAFAWHLRHGFHAHVAHTRIPVPFSYEADDPAGLPSISLMRFPGLLWREAAIIDFDFRGLSSPQKVEAGDGLLKQSGKVARVTRARVGERDATFAGRQGRCVEYSTRFTLSPRLTGYEMNEFQILCGFGPDVSATFMGSPKLKNDFYSIVESAQPLQTKNNGL